MKKRVICAKEIEEALERGETRYYINEKDILTPAAQDIIKLNDIEVIHKKAETKIDMDNFLEMFRTLIKEGMLETLIKELSKEQNYIVETDESGLKIIRGSSVKMKKFKNKNICYREFDEVCENMVVGMLNISADNFSRKLRYPEANYVISGEVKIQIGDRECLVKEGDILVIPTNINMNFISEGDSKILYMSPNSNMEVR